MTLSTVRDTTAEAPCLSERAARCVPPSSRAAGISRGCSEEPGDIRCAEGLLWVMADRRDKCKHWTLNPYGVHICGSNGVGTVLQQFPFSNSTTLYPSGSRGLQKDGSEHVTKPTPLCATIPPDYQRAPELCVGFTPAAPPSGVYKYSPLGPSILGRCVFMQVSLHTSICPPKLVPFSYHPMALKTNEATFENVE
ncbi:hypothetical protein BDZ91DRAFT_709301, partial [Kalaharituber pfeilii]